MLDEAVTDKAACRAKASSDLEATTGAAVDSTELTRDIDVAARDSAVETMEACQADLLITNKTTCAALAMDELQIASGRYVSRRRLQIANGTNVGCNSQG